MVEKVAKGARTGIECLGFSTFPEDERRVSALGWNTGHPVDAGAHPGSGLTLSFPLSLWARLYPENWFHRRRIALSPPSLAPSLSLSYPVRKSRLNYPGRGERKKWDPALCSYFEECTRCANRESGPGQKRARYGEVLALMRHNNPCLIS